MFIGFLSSAFNLVYDAWSKLMFECTDVQFDAWLGRGQSVDVMNRRPSNMAEYYDNLSFNLEQSTYSRTLIFNIFLISTLVCVILILFCEFFCNNLFHTCMACECWDVFVLPSMKWLFSHALIERIFVFPTSIFIHVILTEVWISGSLPGKVGNFCWQKGSK